MSSCGCGNCGCGSGCSCGSSRKGCGMYPDIETSTAATVIIDGLAPKTMYVEGTETSFVVEGGHACKCGDNCKCNPCKC